MSEYKSIFKCRLCGETYESACTGNEEIALQSVVFACLQNENLNFPKLIFPQSPSITEPHHCKNGSFGVADFQGFRKVGNEA